MAHIPNLREKYREEIIPALTKEFSYHTVMQVPKLEKIIINQGVGQAVSDKKIVDTAQEELTMITGQKAIQTMSKKDISNFKLRRKMPIGVKVTLRRDTMYEFLERLDQLLPYRVSATSRESTANLTAGEIIPWELLNRLSFPKLTLTRSARSWVWRSPLLPQPDSDEEAFRTAA